MSYKITANKRIGIRSQNIKEGLKYESGNDSLDNQYHILKTNSDSGAKYIASQRIMKAWYSHGGTAGSAGLGILNGLTGGIFGMVYNAIQHHHNKNLVANGVSSREISDRMSSINAKHQNMANSLLKMQMMASQGHNPSISQLSDTAIQLNKMRAEHKSDFTFAKLGDSPKLQPFSSGYKGDMTRSLNTFGKAFAGLAGQSLEDFNKGVNKTFKDASLAPKIVKGK